MNAGHVASFLLRTFKHQKIGDVQSLNLQDIVLFQKKVSYLGDTFAQLSLRKSLYVL